MKLITTSPKIEKSNKSGLGYYTGIMYLAPSKLSGYNTCSQASPGCIKGCLNTAGRGVYDKVQQARIARTKFFFENRPMFLLQLHMEIRAFIAKCKRLGLKPCLRLNGTSDLFWESFGVVEKYPEIQFYDYTKVYSRMVKFMDGQMPKNYHLTFSLSEVNLDKSLDVLKAGGSVAVVFRNKNLPSQWLGYKVHNADTTDLRFLDKPGIQGLYAKGKAKKDDSGFVVEN